MIKYLTGRDVYEEASRRMDWLYAEFPEVIVSVSGGKDSTIILELAIEAARRANRLPVDALFIDQEMEWNAVIEYMRRIDANPDVNLAWLQCPLRISNGASEIDDWFYCWDEGEGVEWMRPKEPHTIHENIWGTLTFKDLFERYFAWKAKESGLRESEVASIIGIRGEESPVRLMSYTGPHVVYKWITWGGKQGKEGVKFGPIYDWLYQDVWKAIHDNNWDYCSVYDDFYKHGYRIQEMRVSSFTHETALQPVESGLAEIEPETWARLQARIGGVNAIRQLGIRTLVPTVLPPMFESWLEYRDYLVENLIQDPDKRKIFRRIFKRASYDGLFLGTQIEDRWLRACVRALVVNDYHGTTIHNAYVSMRRQALDEKKMAS